MNTDNCNLEEKKEAMFVETTSGDTYTSSGITFINTDQFRHHLR
jgi:hypothetical protein